MSKEGDQQNKKDGGVQKGTHETNPNPINCFSASFKINDSLSNLNENVNKCVKIQDGVSVADDNDITGALSENLHFLSDEIDSYDRAVVENNTEWLKSRCRNIDNVVFDLNASSAGDVSLPLSVSEVGNEIDSLPTLTVTGADIKVDQSQSEIGSLSYETDPIIPLCSESGTLPGDAVFLLQQQDSNINPNAIPNVPSLSLDSSQNVSVDGSLSVFSASSDLGLDKEMFFQVNKNLQPFEFQSITEENQQKNVVLMAPDGNIFAAENDANNLGDSNMRLCVKDGVLSIVSTNQEESEEVSGVVLDEFANRVDTTQSLEKQKVEAQSVQEAQNVVVVNPVEEKISPATTKTEDKPTQPGDFTLATISISNDKNSNSTKILVDTNQGQRLYQINIADFLSPKVQKVQSASTVVAIPYQEVKIQEKTASQNEPEKLHVQVSSDSQESSTQLPAGVAGHGKPFLKDIPLIPVQLKK